MRTLILKLRQKYYYYQELLKSVDDKQDIESIKDRNYYYGVIAAYDSTIDMLLLYLERSETREKKKDKSS